MKNRMTAKFLYTFIGEHQLLDAYQQYTYILCNR